MLRILAPLLISGALGWVVLRLFFRPIGVGLRTAFYSTFGIPIGAGLFGMTAFLVFLVERPGQESILIAFAIPAALAVAAGLLQSSGKLWNPVSLKVTSSDRSDILTILAIALLLTCIASVVLLALYFYNFPHGMWDAHAMWNARARVMFRAPDHWRDVFLPDHPHPDYPLSLSILVFTGWAELGRETQDRSVGHSGCLPLRGSRHCGHRRRDLEEPGLGFGGNQPDAVQYRICCFGWLDVCRFAPQHAICGRDSDIHSGLSGRKCQRTGARTRRSRCSLMRLDEERRQPNDYGSGLRYYGGVPAAPGETDLVPAS